MSETVRPSPVSPPAAPLSNTSQVVAEQLSVQELERSGISINPILSVKYSHRVVFSIDWHQVLDCIRTPSGTLRPTGYILVPEVQEALRSLKRTFPNCIIVINSFCHCEWYCQGVLSILHTTNLVDCCIVTSNRTD